jgi:hypothetical protein
MPAMHGTHAARGSQSLLYSIPGRHGVAGGSRELPCHWCVLCMHAATGVQEEEEQGLSDPPGFPKGPSLHRMVQCALAKLARLPGVKSWALASAQAGKRRRSRNPMNTDHTYQIV